jgi:molecular chaperone DnaK
MIDKVIQIGIDLGTTNSSVAINNKGTVEIVKNDLGDEYTPSVFGIDKAKNKIVGKRAYETLFEHAGLDEEKNYKAEVKRLMGTSETKLFERLGKEMTPEEISAEILIFLKEAIIKRYPKLDTSAAVITVPAYFSTLEAEATKRAGNLAGFEYVVLLQEPIAAAMTYGFSNSENDNWIIYDLGGGTFDVALVSAKDGILSVREHNGDNFLGGKDFDRLIVDQIIKPKILESFNLKNFDGNNEKYKSVFSKLKYKAEEAKIYLSNYKQTIIEIEGIGKDDNKKEISLSIEIARTELEELIKPLVNKTISLTKKTIKDSGMKASSISKIVLVGGPTQIPYVRERLEEELGIEVDSSVDPLTVVARGASIYATSQKIPSIKKTAEKTDGEVTLNLNYEPLTSGDEEMVTGIIEELKEKTDDFYVQIQSENGLYSSSKIKLKNGKFYDNVVLEKKKANLFWIYLFDAKGNQIQTSPDSFSITQGLSVSGAPIPHTIGVIIAEKNKDNILTNTCVPFFEKGSILPLQDVKTFHTSRKLKKGDKDNVLPVDIYEGESKNPDRNQLICHLSITGNDVPYDLSEGIDIDVTISVNESREVFVEAFITSIDLTMKAVSRTKYDDDIVVDDLNSDLISQKERYTNLKDNLSDQENDQIGDMFSTLESSLENATSDLDDKRKANKELKELKSTLDELEQNKKMPQLVKEFNTQVVNVEKLINEVSVEESKIKFSEQFEIIKREGNNAINTEDKTLLIKINEQLRGLAISVVFSNPNSWVYQFKQLVADQNFSDESEAKFYIEKGYKALESNDLEELKRCVLKLIDLLPTEQQKKINSELSGITH